MKNFTKILVAVLALAMLFSLAACGAGKNVSDTDVSDDATGTDGDALKILDTEYITEDYAIAIAKNNTELYKKVNAALDELIADGTVKKIVDKYINGVENDFIFQQNVAADAEELVMATNAEFPPYEYYDGDIIVGIDAEVAAAIADKLGMKLRIDDMAFDAVIASVQTGKADMGMAGLTVDETRKKSVDFTTSYATGVQVIIVPEDSPITCADDLFAEDADFTIGVQTATTGDKYTTEDLEEKGLATIMRYNKGADAVAALVAGKVDCVVIDNEPAKAFVAANNG
jgi:ABC-type amino acid transport substrate-binding protein